MKPSEAKRRLRRIGWVEERLAGSSHAYWRTPTGDRRLMALGHGNAGKIDRNKIAEIRRAERAAARTTEKAQTMQTSEITADVNEPRSHDSFGFTHNLRVYCRQGGPRKSFVDLLLGQTEADRLGGPDAPVSVRQVDGAWILIRDAGSSSRLVSRGKQFKVRARALAAVVPPTGRTFLPAEAIPDGFVLHPDLVEPTPIMVNRRHARKPIAETLPRSPEPARSPPESDKRNGASLDDLRTALEMLRTIAAEVGAELYLDADLIVRARIVI